MANMDKATTRDVIESLVSLREDLLRVADRLDELHLQSEELRRNGSGVAMLGAAVGIVCGALAPFVDGTSLLDDAAAAGTAVSRAGNLVSAGAGLIHDTDESVAMLASDHRWDLLLQQLPPSLTRDVIKTLRDGLEAMKQDVELPTEEAILTWEAVENLYETLTKKPTSGLEAVESSTKAERSLARKGEGKPALQKIMENPAVSSNLETLPQCVFDYWDASASLNYKTKSDAACKLRKAAEILVQTMFQF